MIYFTIKYLANVWCEVKSFAFDDHFNKPLELNYSLIAYL